MTQVLAVKEAMMFLQISKPTIYRLTSKKKIPFFKIGGSVRFRETHLLTWLEKHGVMPREGVGNDREAI